MKLANKTAGLMRRFGMETAVDMLIEAGFDAIDLSFPEDLYDTMPKDDNYYKELRKRAEDKGVTFVQAHAPAPLNNYDEKEIEQLPQKIIEAMRLASCAGVETIIVHPCQHHYYVEDGSAEYLFEYNMTFYRQLIPYAEKFGIKIAVENMWQYPGMVSHSVCSRPGEMIKYIDTLKSDSIVACLDLGHAMLVRERPEDFIRALGNGRLSCLHVHDVDGIDDLHTLPYFGIARWDKIMRALSEIDYKGNLTFEADGFLDGKPDELISDYLKMMEKTGRYLIKLFNS